VYVEINSDKLVHFNNRFELDGMTFEEPVPNLFNFNNPFGACPTCEGFSQVLGIDSDLIPDKRLRCMKGLLRPGKERNLAGGEINL
jgi:excinuclease ABC subunit A